MIIIIILRFIKQSVARKLLLSCPKIKYFGPYITCFLPESGHLKILAGLQQRLWKYPVPLLIIIIIIIIITILLLLIIIIIK